MKVAIKILFFCLLIKYNKVLAQVPSNTTKIQTATPFLLITPDARSSGMGDIGAALQSDGSATNVNVSALVFDNYKSGIAMSHAPWMNSASKETKMSFLSGYVNFQSGYTLAGSLKFFKLGVLNLTDNSQQFIGSVNPTEYSVDLSLAKKLSPNFSLATSVRYIQSNFYPTGTNNGLELKAVKTIGVDVSALFKNDIQLFNSETSLAIGLQLSNIGPKLKYNEDAQANLFLPTNLKLGSSLSFFSGQANRLIFGLDLNKLLVPSPILDKNSNTFSQNTDLSVSSSIIRSFNDADGGFSEEIKEITICSGLEYLIDDRFAFRLGFSYQNPTKGDARYITFGSGWRHRNLKMDVSFLKSSSGISSYANTLRFSLALNFR